MNFQILWIILIFFATLCNKTRSFDPKYEACEPQSCGSTLNISYPFWIAQEHEFYCGSPGFEISCNDNTPSLKIMDDKYIIKDIFYPNHSFLVVNASVSEEQCPTPRHNISLDQTPFTYGPDQADLFLLYYCTSKPVADFTYPVDCATNTTHQSFAGFHEAVLESDSFSSRTSCQSLVNVPVNIDQDDFPKLKAMNYVEIMKMGFLLNWSENNCSSCEISGGRCGNENNEFVCFCRDQPHPKTCSDGKNRNWQLKAGIGAAVAFAGIIIGFILIILYKRWSKQKYASSSMVSRNFSSHPSSVMDFEKGGICFGLHLFSYSELEKATENFDPAKELGDGGFGTVYYGKLRDGRAVAVKRLYENNYKRVEQFMNEVEILTRLRHQNLVSLYGCTSRHSRELLLVYEYIPNGTIADHLHGERAKPDALPWPIRMKIAIETANALAYLHASEIIHRDVKTNNILLDNNYCVKVADFGLSRLFPTDVTHVSTAPQGTPGYVDPEYHQCYQLTDKSDVYSFGVVLIELISSKPAVDITRHRHEINLSNMAINKILNHKLHELVDPCLGFESDVKVNRMINAVAELAFQCLQSVKDIRPSMKEVLDVLKNIQSEACSKEKAEGMEIPADEDVLLTSDALLISPDSVTMNWRSRSSTPNTSG